MLPWDLIDRVRTAPRARGSVRIPPGSPNATRNRGPWAEGLPHCSVAVANRGGDWHDSIVELFAVTQNTRTLMGQAALGDGTGAPVARSGIVLTASSVVCERWEVDVNGFNATGGPLDVEILSGKTPAPVPGFCDIQTGIGPAALNVANSVRIQRVVLTAPGADATWQIDQGTVITHGPVTLRAGGSRLVEPVGLVGAAVVTFAGGVDVWEVHLSSL